MADSTNNVDQMSDQVTEHARERRMNSESCCIKNLKVFQDRRTPHIAAAIQKDSLDTDINTCQVNNLTFGIR